MGRDGDDRALAFGDQALIDAVLADLADTMALRGQPLEVRVSRWPGSFPQYRVGHLDRAQEAGEAVGLVGHPALDAARPRPLAAERILDHVKSEKNPELRGAVVARGTSDIGPMMPGFIQTFLRSTQAE